MSSDKRHIISRLSSPGRQHDVAYWSLLVLTCLVFLVMNVLTTLKEDDLGFSLVDGEWTRIRSFADVLRSMHNHYVGTNGRTADVIALLFCSVFGKTAFNVCNTLVFGLLCHLLSLLSTGRRSVLAVAAFVTCVGTCYPVPGETMLWLAGSCNYMWAITASLLLVWCLLHHPHEMGWGGTILIAVGAVIAGSFNEATSLGFLVGLCLYYAVNRRQVNRMVIITLVCYLVGVFIIISSPAAWERAANGGIVVDLGMQELLSSRWRIFTERLWHFLVPVVAFTVGVAALFKAQWRKAMLSSVWPYVFIALALLMLVLGQMHERSYSPLATVALIIVVGVADRLFAGRQWLRLSLIVICLLFSAFTWGRGIVVLREYKAFDDQTVGEIVDSPEQAVLRARHFEGYSRFIKLMNYNSDNFFAHGVTYCGYYGRENGPFVNDSVYDRFHSGRLLEGAIRIPVTTDRPDVVDSVMAVHGQYYMVVMLSTDTVPYTFQTARYYIQPKSDGMTIEEKKRRESYGLVTDYNPCGFFPLRYQGRTVLIMPYMSGYISHVAFPVALGYDAPEVTLFP